MAISPRMTLDDVLADMRAHGMSMGKAALITCLKEGIFPFAHIIGEPGGKTNFLIMRRDYEAYVSLVTPYLATINNLPTPVQKTADKTMKITYILREEM